MAQLMAALDWAASPDGGGVDLVVWKTTTHRLTGVDGQFTNTIDEAALLTQREDLVMGAFKQRGWPILDAGAATADLAEHARVNANGQDRERIYLDAAHFTRNIYRGLNELLGSMICGGNRSTAWDYPPGVGDPPV